MKNNKGYTLAELLISVTILSVVMISIFALMSSSLKTYTISTKEAELQEEAQVIGNQIEELLCDSVKVFDVVTIHDTDSDGNDFVAGAEYKFTSRDNEGDLKDYSLKYIDDTLYLNGSVLSKDVSSFSIDGYNSGSDNVATLNMVVGEERFDVVRSIHFRNNPENMSFNDIKAIVDEYEVPDDDDDEGVTEKTLVVKRFEEINLTSELGIVSDAKVKVGGTENYTYLKTYAGTDIAAGSIMLKTEPTINKAMNKTIGVSTATDIISDKVTVEGKNIKGETVSAKIQVKAVKVKDGVVSYFHDSTNNGYLNNVLVEGIDLYGALFTCDVECKAQIYKVNTSVSTSNPGTVIFTENGVRSNEYTWNFEHNKNGSTVVYYLPNGDSSNFPGKKVDDYCKQMQIINDSIGGENKLYNCVFVDPNTGGFVVTQSNGGYYGAKCSDLKNKKDFAIRFKLKITYKNDSGAVISTYETSPSYQLINTDQSKFN